MPDSNGSGFFIYLNMESIINHFYNLVPENMKNRYGGFLFNVNEDRYLFCEIIREIEELSNIYNYLMQNKIGNFIIIYNKDEEPITKKEDRVFCLFKIRCIEDETLTLKETLNIRAKGSSIWSKIWSERIDYYEIQINELGQNKPVILNSIYYYIGLAENAVAVASKFEGELTEEDYAIQHYRMNVPIKKGDYFNPNNMLIDISVRDVCEYVKSSFFHNSKDTSTYINYLLSLPLNQKQANLLFARLLFPTYYFDLYDEVILNEREEEDLVSVIVEHKRYEEFLRALYSKLSLKYQMIYINWIKKGATAPLE